MLFTIVPFHRTIVPLHTPLSHHFHISYFSIKKEKFIELCDQIIKIFPGENPLEWYNPSVGNVKSDGWLYQAYIHKRALSKIIGFFQGSTKGLKEFILIFYI